MLLCSQYTMEDLLERIQASEEEIKTYLETIHASQIDGNSDIFLIHIYSLFKMFLLRSNK